MSNPMTTDRSMKEIVDAGALKGLKDYAGNQLWLAHGRLEDAMKDNLKDFVAAVTEARQCIEQAENAYAEIVARGGP